MRSLLIASQKGGVGKTSLVAGFGALAAREEFGRRVLLIDGDQQANLSRRNYGVQGDGGRSLYATVVLGEPLKPVRDVRPGLDLVPGGPALAMVGGARAAADAAGFAMTGNLRSALVQLAEAGEHGLVLIDLGPGEVALLDAALEAVQYVLAPHREDDADLDGVELLIKRVLRARRDVNPELQLLGTVAFARDPRATARNSAIDREVFALLAGSDVQPLQAYIRHAPAAARDARANSLTPQELLSATEQASTDRISMLRRRREGKHQAPTERSVWARPEAADALARDYLAVLREVRQRMAAVETAPNPAPLTTAGT
jgi:cellulose biosynthesis protein BcsQ